MAAQSFLPRLDAPGVVWINDGAAQVFTVAGALAHRAFLIRTANAAERDAQDAAERGDRATADFHQGMADGFRVWTAEISAALAVPRLDVRSAA
jgi:hypothetical protein